MRDEDDDNVAVTLLSACRRFNVASSEGRVVCWYSVMMAFKQTSRIVSDVCYGTIIMRRCSDIHVLLQVDCMCYNDIMLPRFMCGVWICV